MVLLTGSYDHALKFFFSGCKHIRLFSHQTLREREKDRERERESFHTRHFERERKIYR